jgi:hypothetical protein
MRDCRNQVPWECWYLYRDAHTQSGKGQTQWFNSVIPATQEAEIKRIMV